ncbi:MAG: group II truncated hemoglobin [Vitreoscilla sp.]|nr:group II truncated hemoglobin [Vitreoscilla sp.]
MTALPIVAASTNPHFERLGGQAAVQRLVDAFYAAMDERADARTIRAMHAADLGPTKDVLVSYLCEWLGGPRRYSAEQGAPMLRRRHQPFDIDTAARDAWMNCMRQALAQTCDDTELRAALEAALQKVADHLVNLHPSSTHRSP